MTVPFRTFAAFGLAVGLLGVGYLLAPAPGASTTLPQQPKVASAGPAKPVATLVASRPPVPLVTPPRPSSYTPPIETADKSPTGDKPAAVDKPAKPNEPSIAALLADQPSDSPSGDGALAKRAIEFDGYRNVRALAKGPDGMWHGRAMRGRAEIAVRVDAGGNVSAE